jgi:hypothetical protein
MFRAVNLRTKRCFVGCIFAKSLRDFTRSLEKFRGLKDLLHVINAIVFSTKDDVDTTKKQAISHVATVAVTVATWLIGHV